MRTERKATGTTRAARTTLTLGLFRGLLAAAGLLLAFLILMPVGALLTHTSPGAMVQLLREPSTLAALRVTAISSAASTTLVFLIGLPVAYLFSRHLHRGRWLLDSLLELPMVMPPLVAGLALLLAFGRSSFVGELLLPLGIRLPFTLPAVVLVQLFVITPFFVKRTALLFDQVDRRLEAASALLGGGPFHTFFHVTLPLCRRGLVGEGFMALAQGIGMFGAVILFAGNLPGRTQTLSLAVYSAFEGRPDQAFALASLLLCLSGGLLLLFRLLSRPGEQGRTS